MEIGITEPLRRFLRIGPMGAPEGMDPLFCWDANRIVVDGCACLALCNAANRMMGVRRMEAPEWRHIGHVCGELVADTLICSGVPADVAARYVASVGPHTLSRTHGRRALAGMNHAAGLVMRGWEVDRGAAFQAKITRWLNREACRCATRGERGRPCEWIFEDLASHGFGAEEPTGTQARGLARR